jgi:hypothetical protein
MNEKEKNKKIKEGLLKHGIELDDYNQRFDKFRYNGVGETFGDIVISTSIYMGSLMINLSYKHHVIIRGFEQKIEDIQDIDLAVKTVAELYEKMVKRAELIISDL